MELTPKKIIFSNFSSANEHAGPFYSIAFYSPKLTSGFRELPLLFPERDMLHDVKSHKITRQEYIKKYNLLLKQRHIRIKKVLERIPSNSVLCCYCDLTEEGSFCHRQLAAAYISEHFGIEVLVE